MKRLGLDCVHLDISHKPAAFIREHFPTVYERCLSFGIDITREPIPVVPAAHYTCGGVMVDSNGQTDVDQLYAIGETSFTGLHGANRMASNSLLECIVYGRAASRHILQRWDSAPLPDQLPPWDESQVTDSDEDVIIPQLGRAAALHVGLRGIVRPPSACSGPSTGGHAAGGNPRVLQQLPGLRDLLELRNLALVADLIIRSAMLRRRAAGCTHLDYPQLLDEARDTILQPPSADD